MNKMQIFRYSIFILTTVFLIALTGCAGDTFATRFATNLTGMKETIAMQTNSIEGNDFDTAKASQIVNEKTTADEIVALFGSPHSRRLEGSNAERWTYYYGSITTRANLNSSLFGASEHIDSTGEEKTLKILINGDKRVVSFTLQEGPIENEVIKTHSTLGGGTLGRDFDAYKTSQIVKGKTTLDEIVALFGSPSDKRPEEAGAERWRYFHANISASASAVKENVKDLDILINSNKIVVSFTLQEGSLDKINSTPWREDQINLLRR